MGYFKDTIAYINGNEKLRLPQREAYMAAYEYFSENKQGEALIVLPTGTGKSGLISVLPYGISEGRVLIITPGLITKDSILKTISPLEDNFWVNYDVIFDPEDLPTIVEYEADVLDSSLQNSNFVIANIHKLYLDSDNSLLNKVPSDFFDMVIVDEAHHAAASSWKNVLQYFSSAKKVHLTGTPYRGDDEPIPGELIHETTLATAMSLKLVKWLRKSTVNSGEMYFEIPGDPHKYTKDEVIELKDIDWVRKSVALSKECSEIVIDKTIEKLNELRELSPKVNHKILAVACSIKHANDVAQWYREKGETVVIVHSDLEPEVLKDNLRQIDNHECSVVVSVNMLMEGYDHRYLTVLGVFRPYKSMNAFAQIVGRVLRTIPDDEIVDYAIDNNAYIIYHQETGLDGLWKKFQKEIDKSQKIKPREYTITDREYTKRESLYASIEVDDPYSTMEESYLDSIDFKEKFEEAKREIEARINEKISSMDISQFTAEQIEAFRGILRRDETKIEKSKLDELLVLKQPEVARREMRAFLYNNANEAAQDILLQKGIDPKGHELYNKFKSCGLSNLRPTDNNDGILVRYINKRVCYKYGPVNKREPEQLLKSKKYMEQVVEELSKMI